MLGPVGNRLNLGRPAKSIAIWFSGMAASSRPRVGRLGTNPKINLQPGVDRFEAAQHLVERVVLDDVPDRVCRSWTRATEGRLPYTPCTGADDG